MLDIRLARGDVLLAEQYDWISKLAPSARGDLSRQLAMLSDMIETMEEIVLVADVAGHVVHANPAAARLCGYSRHEMLGLSVEDLFDLGVDHRQCLGTCVRDGRSAVLEVAVRRKDNSGFPVQMTVSALRADSAIRGMAILAVDMTDRKRVEEALRRERDFAEGLIETAQVIVLVLDMAGRVVRFNSYMEKVSGHRLREVQGKDWFDTFLPESDREAVRGVFRMAAGEVRTQGYVNPIVTKDGQTREVEWHDTTLKNARGEVIGILAIGQDITDRRRLEDQLRQAQKMEAIGRLAGGMAHDFNNQLTVIKGYCDLLLEGTAEDDPARESLGEIRRASVRAERLTGQLLAFSRRQMLRPERINLNQVVAGIRDLVARMVGEDIELSVTPAGDLGDVEADRSQVEQAIMNLVVNARDAMPDGGSLTIETANVKLDADQAGDHPGARPGPHAMLAISDTGTGMDEQTRRSIFDPFFTTKEVGKGTGLGLSMVYGFVTQSGGAISVDSEPGRGTTFRIYLPCLEASATPSLAPQPDDACLRGTETVLVVEDDDAVRQFIVRVLRQYGYNVVAAAGADEAIALDRRHGGRIHLLLTDVVMPRVRGPELARRLLKGRADLRVLYVSGYTGETMAQRGMLQPGADLLAKPFTSEQLARKTRRVLDGIDGNNGGAV